MQYIFNRPFNDRDSSTRKISNELIATGKVDGIFGANKRVPGTLITTVFEPIQLINNPLRFSGKTYLLTDNGTFSAGQGFASTYKCYGNGIIIGEETGGVTVNFGDIHFFNLPNTGQKIMTSWEKAYSPCGVDNNRGVLPDYYVTNSIQDYVEKKDRVLEFTLNLINSER
jgi:C-terminal processing protease CtpA/Prc